MSECAMVDGKKMLSSEIATRPISAPNSGPCHATSEARGDKYAAALNPPNTAAVSTNEVTSTPFIDVINTSGAIAMPYSNVKAKKRDILATGSAGGAKLNQSSGTNPPTMGNQNGIAAPNGVQAIRNEPNPATPTPAPSKE